MEQGTNTQQQLEQLSVVVGSNDTKTKQTTHTQSKVIETIKQKETDESRQVLKLPSIKEAHKSPRVSLLQKLNLQNTADKALALSLKMIEYRQAREKKRLSMIGEYHQLNQQQELIGSVSRVIDKQNFLKKHGYLRQAHYATISVTPRRNSPLPIVLPRLTLQQRKKAIRHQVEVLARSRVVNERYEARKIVWGLLQQVIEGAVEVYYRKIQRYQGKNKNKRISEILAESIVRRRGRGNLRYSKVLEMEIRNEKIEKQDEDGESLSEKSDHNSDQLQSQGSENSSGSENEQDDDDDDDDDSDDSDGKSGEGSVNAQPSSGDSSR